MGISWSSNSRRRHDHFYNHHHHPPPLPPPPPPPPYYYSPEPPLALPPPPPPPPPPYPLNSYYTAAPGSSCNYGNQIVGPSRFNHHHHQQHPYYYPNNGFPPNRPAVGLGPGLQPQNFVEVEKAKKVRNDVNVHKHTLKVEVDMFNTDQHLVSFDFDATFDGSITISYFAKEEANCKFVPALPEAHTPVKFSFKKGLRQKFQQPTGTGIDLGFFELEDLSKPSPKEDVFPLVIAAETSGHLDDPDMNSSSNMQITQAVLEKNTDDSFQVNVIRQILWVEGVRYELREIYGIGSSTAESFDDSDPGKECVICMTEPKDTAVLPCRHMCMCGECAKALRMQSNKCPICRQPIEELIEIKISNGDQ